MTRKLYRLLARAQLDGEVRQSGYRFAMEKGERGPHKTTATMRDEPLYEEVKEGEPGYHEFMAEEAYRQFMEEAKKAETAR